MANLNPDNNTDADDWEDNQRAYSEQISKWPLAVSIGDLFCLAFETMTQGDYSWDCIPAMQVYEVVSNPSPVKGSASVFAEFGLSKEELLGGIEVIKAMKVKAESWARSLAKEFESVDDECDGGPYLSLDERVDDFVSDAADEDDGLACIRKNDPILFHEICLEICRILATRQKD
jgi:hypothetical protein